MLYSMVNPVVILLTLSTAFALQAAEGGARNKFFFYLFMLLLVSAICLLVVPAASKVLFTGLSV